jgi:hypothetical protein
VHRTRHALALQARNGVSVRGAHQVEVAADSIAEADFVDESGGS